MTARRPRRRDDLPRRGLAPRTPPCASEAVTPLAPPDRRAPAPRNAAASRQDVRARLKEPQGAARPVRLHRDGRRWWSASTRQRPWPVLRRRRPRPRHHRPGVWRPRAVRALVAAVVSPNAARGRRLLAAGGGRRRAGPPLQGADRAPARRLVLVRQGPGEQDRVVPVATRTLARGRGSGTRAPPRPWGCPARDQPTPLPATPRQKPVTRVVRPSGLATEAALPTRRPSDATPLVARGRAGRLIPARLGHPRPRTPARDPPRPPTTVAVGHAPRTARMAAGSRCGSRGLPAVAAVWRRAGPADRARGGADRRPSHHRAREARIDGRPAACGGPRWPWAHGGPAPAADPACRHRRGPTGPHQDPAAWRAERPQARRPGPAWPVVCTVPHALGAVGRRPPQTRDDLRRRAAAHARIQLAAAPPSGGGRIGGWCVRHTWTPTVAAPPHGHGLVPAGGGSADRTAWRPARASSVAPVPARSTRWRGLVRALVPQERPDRLMPASVWPRGGSSPATRPCPARRRAGLTGAGLATGAHGPLAAGARARTATAAAAPRTPPTTAGRP
jgi:Putative transposase